MKILIISFTVTMGLLGNAEAFIPPAKMIFERLVENNGIGNYQIELELQFLQGSEPLVVRETWVSEGEKGILLIAHGQGSLKDRFHYQAVYAGGMKWTSQGSTKIPAEMAERPFHLRTIDSLTQWMQNAGALPSNWVTEKSSLSRLSRAGGVVNYLFQAPNSSALSPSVWIEQDQFVLRKVRWPTQSELLVEDSGSYSRNFQYPHLRTLSWETQSVQIKTLSVVGKVSMSKPLQTQQIPPAVWPKEDSTSQENLQQFYQRFR